MAPSRRIEYYIVTAKVPVIGKKEEVAISVLSAERGIKHREGDVSRYLLLPFDASDRLDEWVKNRAAYLSDAKARYAGAIRSLTRDASPFSALQVHKAKNHGWMNINEDNRRVTFEKGNLFSKVDERRRPWVMIGDDYLRKFSPETPEAIKEAKSRHPK